MTATRPTPDDSVPATMLPGHVGVSEVIRSVGIALRRSFPTSLWVKGEVSDYRVPAQGHHYFNLVERQKDGSQAVLPCSIWKSNWPSLRQKLLNSGIDLTAGQEMLFQGTVRLYDGAGRLTFHVSDVYPEFSLGQIEAQRRAILARLQRERLLGLNRQLEMPVVPLRVAVLSSRNAAGLGDFQKVISNSGYGFSVLHCEVPVQGPLVERSVCRALEILALKQSELKIDAICIVRGGGSATDLGWWNSYAICAAIAKMSVPVITGLGHERDRVAADVVAHSVAHTPTAAAELLCSLARGAESELRETADRMAAAVDRLLADASHIVESVRQSLLHATTARLSMENNLIQSIREQYVANARHTLAPHTEAITRLHGAVVGDAGRAVRAEVRSILDVQSAVRTTAQQKAREAGDRLGVATADFTKLVRRNLGHLAERHDRMIAEVATLADHEINQKEKRLRHLTDLVQAYDPVHVLRRGFSITLDTKGKTIKSAAGLDPGETITTRLAAGQITSTITQTS